MDREDLFGSLIIIAVVILVFLYIGAGCSVEIVNIQQDALCRHFNHADSHITWDGFVDGTGEYTVECIDYVPLEEMEVK